MSAPERALLAALVIIAVCGLLYCAADLWRIKRAAEREVDAIIDGTAGERPITVRRPDGALVTTTLDPRKVESIERFLDTVRMPEPRVGKESRAGDD